MDLCKYMYVRKYTCTVCMCDCRCRCMCVCLCVYCDSDCSIAVYIQYSCTFKLQVHTCSRCNR